MLYQGNGMGGGKGMNQTFRDQLVKWKNMHQEEQTPKKKSVGNRKETLSQRDLEELMGIRKPTYKRHNGALRQRGVIMYGDKYCGIN